MHVRRSDSKVPALANVSFEERRVSFPSWKEKRKSVSQVSRCRLAFRNLVHNLSLTDLTEQQRLTWYSTENDVKMCVVKGTPEENCQNYIRILVKTGSSNLFVCATNAFKPMCRDYTVHAGNYSMVKEKGGQARCPYDPQHNSTFVYVDGELYTGTVADFAGMDPIIYREPLQTEQYDSMSLNGE